jgi:hypothetical protein
MSTKEGTMIEIKSDYKSNGLTVDSKNKIPK